MPTIAAAGPRPLRPGRNLCPHRPLLHAEIVIRLRHNRSAGGKLPAGSKCQESSNLCRRPSVLLSPSRRSCRFAADGSGCQWRRPGRQLKAVGSLLSRLVVGRHQRRRVRAVGGRFGGQQCSRAHGHLLGDQPCITTSAASRRCITTSAASTGRTHERRVNRVQFRCDNHTAGALGRRKR